MAINVDCIEIQREKTDPNIFRATAHLSLAIDFLHSFS